MQGNRDKIEGFLSNDLMDILDLIKMLVTRTLR